MIPLLLVHYHGDVQIEYWEYTLALVYALILYTYFARKKAVRIKKAPEYKYFLWGLMAKLVGGTFVGLTYFYYYNGGDTIAYFYSAAAMRNLAMVEPMSYVRCLFGENSLENWSVYTWETGKPYQYVYFDTRTFTIIRFISVLAILTFNSYLITSLLIASASFFGIWACYRTFVGYFPQIAGKLAIAFLFMPSVVYWGSGILKDTFTLSAACWFIHGVDEVFYRKRNIFQNSGIVFCSAIVMIMIKPYIFMVLFPVVTLWLFYYRVSKIKNALVKFVFVPFAFAAVFAVSFGVLLRLGDSLDKFALDGVLETIQVTQADLLKEESYGTNSFDIGKLDGTWGGVLSKFHIAVNASLFRPYVWESNNPAMFLSGLENLWVLYFTIVILFRIGPFYLIRVFIGNPLILMSLSFALIFAFMVGVTTPNFGALVRFKIPLVPFYVSALYMTLYIKRLERSRTSRGWKFDLRDFRMGSAHLDKYAGVPKKEHLSSFVKPQGANTKSPS